MITERDRRLLSEIIAIVKPAGSLAARLEKLTSEQRDCYAEWEARYEQWIERCKAQCPDDEEEDACLYARSLEEDDYGPRLPSENYEPKLHRRTRIALYGANLAAIPITASDNDAARIYREFCDEQ
ncbi:hypothetical protein ABIF63_005763 [Bradyrhizobium japonicum]|uniref:Uncharacterized protein n=1 Tax=Bradyrhizobium japonicum TaxID=375 RepID=A0ABV2RXP0_BRAJP|nr:hypothetical protein [Bradyrhizobium japonicum]UQD95248.1 hypothetical protein JEY30_26890 [Bradyrhizobium japonicum]WLB23441.1 hypothetical protein QIH95_22375 [Bradyrhizobium japonicum]